MDKPHEFLTSRSRRANTLRCARARYWLDEAWGTGFTPARVAVPLATGTATHAGVASLLKMRIGDTIGDTRGFTPAEIDAAVAEAHADYAQTCSGRRFQIDELESQSYVYGEQRALTEALTRLAAMRVVPALLDSYEILEVERLDRRALVEPDEPGDRVITWRSITDALMRSRSDGQLYLLSWKTASELPRDSEARVDMQGVSEAWALDERVRAQYGSGIRGVQMAFLVKGQRRKGSAAQEKALTDAAGTPVSLYKQASPLIYGYQDKSFPPKLAWASDWRCTVPHPMRKSQWYPSGECPGDGRLHKRGDDWQSFPVWGAMGVREWMEMLDDGQVTPEAGDALGEQWALPVPNFRTQEQIGAWLRQTRAAEARIASDLAFLRPYEEALRESPGDEELWEAW